MEKIQDVVSSLEHALPAPERLWDWWSDSTRSPFETAKTVLFCYVLATQTVRIFRHLRARGLRRSVADGYVWTSKVAYANLFTA
jgi:sphinganine-1-phosphate aldolase